MAIEILDLPIKNGDFPSKMALFLDNPGDFFPTGRQVSAGSLKQLVCFGMGPEKFLVHFQVEKNS